MEPRRLTLYITVMVTVSVSSTKEDPDNLQPAKIFGNTLVTVGGKLQLKCIIFDKSESSDDLHMYLCKNGVGVKMGPLEQRDEHTFILRNVSKQDSGNYSCVYSRNKYALKKVRAPAQKSIQVQVTDASFSVTEHPQKNLGTSEQKSDPVQLSVSRYTFLVILPVLLLVVILFLGRNRIRAGMCTKLCQRQGQSGQDNNTGPCDGVSERATQAVNREESLNDMCEYSTIPDLKVKRRPVDVCNADRGTYSLANDSVVYSLVQHPDRKTKSKQPAGEPVYGKVQKKKKEKAYDDSFMSE